MLLVERIFNGVNYQSTDISLNIASQLLNIVSITSVFLFFFKSTLFSMPCIYRTGLCTQRSVYMPKKLQVLWYVNSNFGLLSCISLLTICNPNIIHHIHGNIVNESPNCVCYFPVHWISHFFIKDLVHVQTIYF